MTFDTVVVPAPQVHGNDEAHQVDPVLQIDHKDERCATSVVLASKPVVSVSMHVPFLRRG